MKKLSKDDVLNLARLSRLNLTEEEVDQYQKELDAILDYVKRLESVDTSGLEPTYQVTGLKNVTREDKVIQLQASQNELLKGAPQSHGSYIKVGRMI